MLRGGDEVPVPRKVLAMLCDYALGGAYRTSVQAYEPMPELTEAARRNTKVLALAHVRVVGAVVTGLTTQHSGLGEDDARDWLGAQVLALLTVEVSREKRRNGQ